MFKKSLLFLLLTLFICSACKKESKVVAPIKVSFKKEGELFIRNNITDSIVATFDIEIAESDYEIQTGLMYRDALEEHQAMLFIFPSAQPRSFYMKNTRIALDIIYFDAEGKLVSVQNNTKPFDETSLPSIAPAQYVLETVAGLTEQLDLRIGDRIEFSKL